MEILGLEKNHFYRINEKNKTESHKLLSAWGMSAKMAANGIRTHAAPTGDVL